MKNDDSEDLSLMKQGAREVCWEVWAVALERRLFQSLAKWL